jgi:hypothetical protein
MTMNIKRRLKPQDIVALATIQHLAPSQIAPIAGISRQAVWKALKRQGVITGKGPGGLTRVQYLCDFCGNPSEMTRARWRNSSKHFCCEACYFASLENPGYHPWRQGQRLARAIVSQYFHINDGNVVHHKNGDNHNNDRSNLAVFRSQSDHIKHHRGQSINPLWDGSN